MFLYKNLRFKIYLCIFFIFLCFFVINICSAFGIIIFFDNFFLYRNRRNGNTNSTYFITV